MSNYRHGMAYSSEHKTWCNIRSRCHDPNNNRFRYYGARGIKVCPRWHESFENFIADMGPKPGPSYTIERKDVHGDYEPGNCVWLHKSCQATNRTDTMRVTANGVTMALADWCRQTGLKATTVYMRIRKYGWNPEMAVITPARRHKPYGTTKTHE